MSLKLCSWAPNPGRGGEERLVGLNPKVELRTPPRRVVVVGFPAPSLVLGPREATARLTQCLPPSSSSS